MNIFLAAIYTNHYKPGMRHFPKLNEREQEIVLGLPHILESYHYVNKQSFVDAMRNDNAQVFVDSGAFSAFTLGATIDLPTYCDYIKRNEDIIRKEDGILMASVLDGIGDPLQTYRNQLDMEYLGAKPLPCFHYGEDPRYLEWYLQNYEYITIGGLVGKSKVQQIQWLDEVWGKYMTDGSGRAKIKVHGFGVTSVELMERYPWYSCDSSSWIQAAAFGSIVSPDYGPLSVSDKSPSRHTQGQHLSNLSELETDALYTMLEKQGFTYERLSTVYESRAAYNMWSFGMVNASITAAHSEKFKAIVQTLF